MADYDYDFCFRGVDGEECTNFIRQVRRKAFEAGKSRDKEWMADYAVSCFADDALKWSVEASSDVLENWDVLQRTLMEEYCKHRIPSAGLSGAAAPTPAAAPAPGPGTTLPTNASTMTGYIRIVAETPEAGNYISRTVDREFGVLRTCTDLEAAARVKLIPLMSSYGVQLLDFPGPYCWLGILGCELEEGGRIGPESRGNLCPASAPTSHVMGTSVTELPGAARSNIWIFQAVDSCIISVWNDSAFTYVLEPLINLGNKRILAVSNCLIYSASVPSTKYAKARLIFEPA